MIPRLRARPRRGLPRRHAAASDTISTTFGPCGLVFQAPLESARFGLAPQALAFAVAGLAHGRTAVVPAIRRWGAR